MLKYLIQSDTAKSRHIFMMVMLPESKNVSLFDFHASIMNKYQG